MYGEDPWLPVAEEKGKNVAGLILSSYPNRNTHKKRCRYLTDHTHRKEIGARKPWGRKDAILYSGDQRRDADWIRIRYLRGNFRFF